MVVHINQLYHVQPLNQNPQDLTSLPSFIFPATFYFHILGRWDLVLSVMKCWYSAFTEFISFNPNYPIRG